MKPATLKKKFLLLLFSVFLSVLIAEFALRILKPVKLYQLSKRFYNPSPNQTIIYEPRPNSTSKYNSYWFNDDGIRSDKGYTLENSSHNFRIAVIGDSLAYGFRLKSSSTYISLLEHKLNNNLHSYKISSEIMNFGVVGYRTIQILERFKEKVIKYNPDLVIYHFWLDDVTLKQDLSGISFFSNPANVLIDKIIKMIKTDETLMSLPGKLLIQSHLVRNILVLLKEQFSQDFSGNHFYLAKSAEPDQEILRIYDAYSNKVKNSVYNDIAYIEPYYKYYTVKEDFIVWNNCIKELSDICKLKNIELLLLITPVLYDYDQYNWRPLHRFIKDIAQQYSIPVFDITDSFKGYKASEICFDDEHPNQLGNKIIADSLFEYIYPDYVLRKFNDIRKKK